MSASTGLPMPSDRPSRRRYSVSSAERKASPPVPSVRMWKNSTLTRSPKYTTLKACASPAAMSMGAQGGSVSGLTSKRRFAASM